MLENECHHSDRSPRRTVPEPSQRWTRRSCQARQFAPFAFVGFGWMHWMMDRQLHRTRRMVGRFSLRQKTESACKKRGFSITQRLLIVRETNGVREGCGRPCRRSIAAAVSVVLGSPRSFSEYLDETKGPSDKRTPLGLRFSSCGSGGESVAEMLPCGFASDERTVCSDASRLLSDAACAP